MLFFGDDYGYFGEFIGSHVAVVEKKGFFWSEEIHSFICLVVDYAVAAVLKAYEVYDLGRIVGEGGLDV